MLILDKTFTNCLIYFFFLRLKKLHLNGNNITCIPNLKIFRKNHVYQEFNKSYYKRKNKSS